MTQAGTTWSARPAGHDAPCADGTPGGLAQADRFLARTLEDIFGLPHLGDAAMPQARPFGPDVFS
jgi:hypothetical protein